MGLKGRFNNVITTVDQIKFRSKAEAKRYAELKLLQERGIVRFFIRQPKFDLGGGVSYSGDFLVFTADPDSPGNVIISLEDVKGLTAPLEKDFIRNAKLVAVKYGIEVEIVRR